MDRWAVNIAKYREIRQHISKKWWTDRKIIDIASKR
jgi:hypothetical protein